MNKPSEKTLENRIGSTLGFLRSVINCGEPWTKTCEDKFNDALYALDQLDAQRSQGGEWTVEPCVGPISGQTWPGLAYVRISKDKCFGSLNEQQARAICAAHNATLRPAPRKEAK